MKTKIFLFLIALLPAIVSAQWENMNNGLVGTWGGSVTCLAISGSDLYAGTWGGGIFISHNDGATWDRIFISPEEKLMYESNKSGWVIYRMFADSSCIYAAVGDKGFYVSKDKGANWIQCNDGLTNMKINDIVVNNNKIYIATMGGIFTSDTNNINWTTFNIPAKQPWFECVAVNDSIIVAGNFGYGIYVSTNHGKTWNMRSKNYESAEIYDLFFDRNTIYAGCSNAPAVFIKSIDYGLNWESIDYFKINVTAMIKANNCLITGCQYYQGVNISLNGGYEWYSKSQGLMAEMIRDIIASNNHLFVAARNGLFRIPIASLLTSIEQQYFPATFSLSQNYPNPFNSETTINYQLPTPGFVTLKVYDLLGREVATLVDEYKQAGTYNSKFSIINLPAGRQGYKLSSGVYFYHLQAGSYSETKKFVLMK